MNAYWISESGKQKLNSYIHMCTYRMIVKISALKYPRGVINTADYVSLISMYHLWIIFLFIFYSILSWPRKVTSTLVGLLNHIHHLELESSCYWISIEYFYQKCEIYKRFMMEKICTYIFVEMGTLLVLFVKTKWCIIKIHWLYSVVMPQTYIACTV